jgi:flagellar hook protein FlgE
VLQAAVDGNAPSDVERIEFSSTGVLYAVFRNGARLATHRIPLADVTSPDNLAALPGNVFAPSVNSGDIRIGFAGAGGLGEIISGALEQSTVDLASELTAMIESQRNYTANSKVFQTGADLMDVLVNLKR